MVRFSNTLFGLLNVATFLLSIPILGAGIWLATISDTECEKSLVWPAISLGALLMVVSLAGLVGVCCKVQWVLWLYLLVMFLLILMLFFNTVFFFVESSKSKNDSTWLRKRVFKPSNWRKTKSCIRDCDDCKNLAQDSVHDTEKQFYKRSLSSIESGCCKPPTSCGFTYVNATYWVPSATSVNTSDSDCATWSNDESQLCYDCSSCKRGEVARLKKDLKKDAMIEVAVLVAVVVLYGIGLCTFRNIRRGKGLHVPPGGE